MPAGNNFTGNPLWEVHFHPAGSDVDRGVPFPGKVVLRTDGTPPFYETCVDTDPDPTEDGGGTWEPLGRGGAYATWTPVLAQGGTTFTMTTIYSRIRSDGARVEGACAVQITAGTGVATFPVKLSGMLPLAGASAIGGGYYFATVGGARFDGWLAPGLLSGDTITGFSKIGSTASLGASETLDVDDVIVAEFWYPT